MRPEQLLILFLSTRCFSAPMHKPFCGCRSSPTASRSFFARPSFTAPRLLLFSRPRLWRLREPPLQVLLVCRQALFKHIEARRHSPNIFAHIGHRERKRERPGAVSSIAAPGFCPAGRNISPFPVHSHASLMWSSWIKRATARAPGYFFPASIAFKSLAVPSEKFFRLSLFANSSRPTAAAASACLNLGRAANQSLASLALHKVPSFSRVCERTCSAISLS